MCSNETSICKKKIQLVTPYIKLSNDVKIRNHHAMFTPCFLKFRFTDIRFISLEQVTYVNQMFYISCYTDE